MPIFVLLPDGPQRRERLGPGGAVGVRGRSGDLVARGVTRSLSVSGICLLNLGSVGAVDVVEVGWG
jgi:hypothetical protein